VDKKSTEEAAALPSDELLVLSREDGGWDVGGLISAYLNIGSYPS